MGLENLRSIETNLVARIIEVTASAQPNYTVNGQSFSKGDYLATLMAQLKACRDLIAKDGENTFMIFSRLVP